MARCRITGPNQTLNKGVTRVPTFYRRLGVFATREALGNARALHEVLHAITKPIVSVRERWVDI